MITCKFLHTNSFCFHEDAGEEASDDEAEEHQEEEGTRLRAYRMNLRLILKMISYSHLNLCPRLSRFKHSIKVFDESLTQDEDFVCERSHLSIH